jgi:hypothetical protein
MRWLGAAAGLDRAKGAVRPSHEFLPPFCGLASTEPESFALIPMHLRGFEARRPREARAEIGYLAGARRGLTSGATRSHYLAARKIPTAPLVASANACVTNG